MKLRYYQEAAIDAVWRHVRCVKTNPCVVIPTGGGKTPVLAALCKQIVNEWNGRVLVVAHVKELLEQAFRTLSILAEGIQVGLYSAGLKSRDLGSSVTVAGIQSIFRRADQLGHIDIVIIDEAQRIPPSGDGMYRRLVRVLKVVNPDLVCVGLTATPYRTKSGMLCGENEILNAICYEVSIAELTKKGYLSRLTTRVASKSADLSCVPLSAGDFHRGEMEAVMRSEGLIESAVDEMLVRAAGRRSCLVFCAGILHSDEVAAELVKRGERVKWLYGSTPANERANTVRRFKAGEIRWLCNVNVLTIGFDYPGIDCVVLLRGTVSPGLFYQMCGRGFRVADNKDDCLLLDFGGNLLRHGPVDAVQPTNGGMASKGGSGCWKTCDKCDTVVRRLDRLCPECGFEFWTEEEERERHEAEASRESPYAQVVEDWFDVKKVTYHVHVKSGGSPGDPRTMRVEYEYGFFRTWKEWVCLEHEGFARRKAVAWWSERSFAEPPTVIEDAVALASSGELGEPSRVKVRVDPRERFPTITGYELEEIPEEIPF